MRSKRGRSYSIVKVVYRVAELEGGIRAKGTTLPKIMSGPEVREDSARVGALPRYRRDPPSDRSLWGGSSRPRARSKELLVNGLARFPSLAHGR